MSTPMVRRVGIGCHYMRTRMADERDSRAQVQDRPYRVYGREGRSRPQADPRPYTVYRSRPRGLKALLRGEEEIGLPSGLDREPGRGPKAPGKRRITPWRVLKYVLIAIAAWLLLSLVLFMISAQSETGNLPSSASAALTGGSNMITGTDTVLILGTDQRPRTGPGSKEPGSNYSDAGANSDTIMLWRIGGGTSRRLSIPRDTVAQIPGHGLGKINAGYAIGGPALAIKTVENFTGVKINHIIIVNLGAFPKFIDAIGGVDVKTERICANVSGGLANGGFRLDLTAGDHHLNGLQALLYSRIRENPCNPADNDLTRVQHQQQILNAIKSKLFSPSSFFHLPWASWDAPKVLRTDMGGPTLMTLFAASEIGGSAPVDVLKPTGAEALPGYGNALTVTPQAVQAAVSKLMNG
jgi:LCP family protein required for cell wall assembly